MIEIKLYENKDRKYFINGDNGLKLREELKLDDKDKDSNSYELDFGSARPTSKFLLELLGKSYISTNFFEKYKVKGDRSVLLKLKVVFRMMREYFKDEKR